MQAGGNIMKLIAKVSPLLFLILLLLAVPSAQGQLPVNSAAPEFSLRDQDGNVVSLADFENKAVLLFFVGYNCPYCRGKY